MNRAFLFFYMISTVGFAQTDSIPLFFEKNQFIVERNQLQEIEIDSTILSIVIKGYTDETGSEAYNLALSAKRADAVKRFFIQAGKEKLIVASKGYGVIHSMKGASNDNPNNRRVDILISRVPRAEKPIIEVNKSVIKDSSLSLIQEFDEIEVGEKFVMKNLSFLPGQHLLLKGAQATLDSLTSILKNNPSLKIAIEGHICCERQFSDGFDRMTGKRNLSHARAEYIYTELIKRGIEKGRLSYEGFGRRQPIHPNEVNERQKQANRRVEIRIVER